MFPMYIVEKTMRVNMVQLERWKYLVTNHLNYYLPIVMKNIKHEFVTSKDSIIQMIQR